ncbi:hypothetical protein [Zoogloea sp.]|uniref:hypothetical protein n=1 Tax=Zoogloea sp. TaxID=49181 RepID=UPI001DAE5852|nr:hypothetical protein [Zoogloea sp.]MBK6653032.1 hypothetical protein [Zoogloea sp.]
MQLNKHPGHHFVSRLEADLAEQRDLLCHPILILDGEPHGFVGLEICFGANEFLFLLAGTG